MNNGPLEAVLLDNWLSQRALTCPERIALVVGGDQLDYAQLELEAASMARRLAGLGVRRGSTVAISLPPSLDYGVLIHALMKLGAIAYPLDPRLGKGEREAAFDGNGPALSITSPDQLRGGEADLPLLGEIDLAQVHCRILTGGSSGVPRPIALTYGNQLWSAIGSGFNLGVDPADRWLCCLPPFHVSGLSILLRSVIYGTTAVVHDGFEVDRVAAALAEDEITLVSLVATQLARLLDAGAAVERPRAILIGGGPVPPEMLEEATGRGAAVVQTYGLTEAASQVTTLSPQDASRKLGSAGRPLLTTHVRIDGGEILVQGPTVAADCADEDGWLHTGDRGRIDEEGFLYVTGRLGETIVSGGENVMPEEVEEVLRRHPAVADAAVVGRPDPEWQEAVHAMVVLADGIDVSEPDLREHCAAELAAFKVPKTVEFVGELPRTEAGKLRRRELTG